ncbi:heavy metal translocating P-type ATPase [Candidatus Aminicenantes bacterium AC-335-G13]|nr:heavy metal translocating P-type ATPase [Candidatus Aminicenantes bacterium AC-335-G13]
MIKGQKKKVELKISGMTCASCVRTIEKSLLNLKGVRKAEVNLGKETAVVEYDSSEIGLIEIEKAIRDSGYKVINEEVILKIGGMTCAMCVRSIENALKNLDGVLHVNVNLGTEKAHVIFNPRMITIADMRKAIEDTGYQYLGIEGEKEEDAEKILREKELKEKQKRFIIGLAVGGFLLALGYLPIKFPFSLPYFMLIISTPVFFFISYPIFKAGYRALRNKNLNMDVMYSMGIGVAFFTSVFATFGFVFSTEFLFYDTAVLLASFLTLGRYLEARAKGKTSEAIKKLIGLQPKTALVIRDNKEIEIPIEDVRINDLVIVKPGEKIPVDGEVIEGESFVDESMITGESIPVFKEKGKTVIGGTLNKNGIIKFKATKVGKDTVLAQIIKLVEEAQASKPPLQRIADKAVSYFIPAVLAIAIISFISWYFIFSDTLLFALNSLISVLVIACPCALGLATPTAVTVGIGRGAEFGILIKNGEALEISPKLSTIIFDKTGTLTKGKPEVTDIIGINVDKNELLKLTASIEKNSQHPLAEAIVKKAQEFDIKLERVTKFNTFGGKGVIAVINGKEVLIGNRKLLQEKGISYSQEIEERISFLENQGKTVILVAMENKLIGIFGVADTLKETAKKAVEAIKNMKIDVGMITGDNARTAKAIAKQIGINKVLAEVLPQEKAKAVKNLQNEGEIIAFVGDGINDAPALVQADVGIAIGSGTDVAIESGDIVLMKDNLLDVVAAVQLSKKVMKRIKQNLFWAFAYNTALIPVAAGVLYPFFHITFRPELAGLAMAMSSVTVVTLSLMLKKYIPPIKK